MALPAAVTPAQAQPVFDELGRPAPHIVKQIEGIAQSDILPEKLSGSLERLVKFIRGDGKSGVALPENAPKFHQFRWPTVAGECIGGKNKATGLAMAVPGPAAIPLPGVREGEVNFVFTALGTGTVAQEQAATMKVTWMNLSNGKTGTTPLAYTGMNPEGPATINGIAKTGKGNIVAILEGGVTTEESTGNSNCNFFPTAAFFDVK